METGESSERAPLETSPELAYGRDLFIQMFQESTPLGSLGYSMPQIEEARKALKQLENEQGQTTSPLRVSFWDDDHFYGSVVGVNFEGKDLEKEIYHLNSHRSIFHIIMSELPQDASEEEIEEKKFQAIFDASQVKIKTLKENENFLLGITAFPEDVDTENIDFLVKNIARGQGFATGASFEMKKPTVWNKFSQKFNRRGPYTYRAAWLDDRTKRDLVIEYSSHHLQRMSKIYKKGMQVDPHMYDDVDTSDARIQIWRRLGVQELDGKKWTPFGLKLNSSSEQAMAAFASQENVTFGQFAYSPQS